MTGLGYEDLQIFQIAANRQLEGIGLHYEVALCRDLDLSVGQSLQEESTILVRCRCGVVGCSVVPYFDLNTRDRPSRVGVDEVSCDNPCWQTKCTSKRREDAAEGRAPLRRAAGRSSSDGTTERQAVCTAGRGAVRIGQQRPPRPQGGAAERANPEGGHKLVTSLRVAR